MDLAMFKWPPRSITLFVLLACLWINVATAQSQDKEVVTRTEYITSQSKPAITSSTTTQTVKAKYEGGVFGYRQKRDGTLVFDDENQRLLFRDKNQKDIFSIPYDSVTAAFADSQSKRPETTSAIGSASIYTLPALLVKKKSSYLSLRYYERETQADSTASFKLPSKGDSESALATLASHAKLEARGDMYVKRR